MLTPRNILRRVQHDPQHFVCFILWTMKKLIKQFMKFGVVGTIAFIIDYGLMVLLTEVFGINYLVSTTVSFIVSVIFNYIASMRYVFRHKEDMSRRKEFVIFVVLSVIGLIFNDALMWLFTSIVGISYLISKLIATVMVTFYNFLTRKKFLDAGDSQESVAEEVLESLE